MPTLPNISNLTFAEDLYEDFLRDPASVTPDWQSYFAEIANGELRFPHPHFGPSFQPSSTFNPPSTGRRAPTRDAPQSAALQDRLYLLIRLYRVRGHRIARVDPLGRVPPIPPELEPEFFGFTEADMDLPVHSETFQYDGPLTLGGLLQRLRNTYCRSIGVQYMHIDDLGVRRWLQRRMESTENHLQLTRDEQLRILTRLTDAVTFEEFIRKKFIGAKTFSLEGSESLIPLLDLAIEKAGEQGIRDIILGMAHRGRLNVLANIMGKSARQIFREFADTQWKSSPGRGDVKYHLGHSSEWTTAAGEKIELALCFNPSHLEFVNAVALGRTRARQDRVGQTFLSAGSGDTSFREANVVFRETNSRRAWEAIPVAGRTTGLESPVNRQTGMSALPGSLTILIHGDAAFAGEGITQETLNLSQLRAYTVGGTLHVVVNNQIGFTTGPEELRSSQYATDVAKMLQIPIFHVNGEDPEAVAQVVRLAMDFRREFQRDVVVDMFGYRRLGHNESDEPSFTQPQLYHLIAKRKSVREGYLEHLLTLGGITLEEADAIAAKRRELLEKELSQSQKEELAPGRAAPSTPTLLATAGNDAPGEARPTMPPAVPREKLSTLLEATARVPADFHPHPKIKKILQTRRQMASGELPLDWSAAEALAFASLAVDGVRIRLTGQDSERGTFSHRHAVLHDYQDGRKYSPLQHLGDGSRRREETDDEGNDLGLVTPAATGVAPVEIYNSPLSETGVLGFEYGYSLDSPRALVLWEAQYGDFWNVAQPIVDQFIASAEDKWRQFSGLVLLLPHGYEGGGPEHSSARLERFLWLGAEENIQVVYPTTPAQYFHCLRRQAFRAPPKPLVVMTPKSMLRHAKVVSSLDDCAGKSFQQILGDDPSRPASQVRRVLLCTGKIYYELAEHREQTGANDVAIVRLEQLYPLDRELLERVLAPYSDGTPAFWVQEEPANMGAWNYLRIQFGEKLLGRLPFNGIARAVSATPATGSARRHKQEQAEIIQRAFANEQ